jgi:uncharacterized protein (DUF433 family)
MATVEPMTHVRLDERGRAWIDDTNVKVIEVIKDWMAHGSSPEEICYQYPHLSLAQVYAALAYYHDHQQVIDCAIAEELQRWEVQTRDPAESPIRRKLRAMGKLS